MASSTMLSDKEKKKLAAKHAKILSELVKHPDNANCADCGAQGPRWASWNNGIFLCIHCAGVHRRIGTHISKVKSISLDMWTAEQIEHFRKIGNVRANAFFNPHPARHPFNKNWSDRERERYIRDKYERRYFVDYANGTPDPTTGENDEEDIPTPARDEAYGLMRLREMGFKDVKANHAALTKTNYDVDAAAKLLRRDRSGSSASSVFTDDHIKVKQLVRMGFEDKAQNVIALQKANGDINNAIEFLVSDTPPEVPSKKTTSTGATAASSNKQSAANDLLGLDLLGGGPPPTSMADISNTSIPSSTNGVSSITNKMAGVNISESQAAPAQTKQQPVDLFGDFGDFLSAPSQPKPATSTQANVISTSSNTVPVANSTAMSTSIGSYSASPATKPTQVPESVSKATSPESNASKAGSSSIFDKDFIMSLYSKPPGASSGGASTTASQPGFISADIDPWGSFGNTTTTTSTSANKKGTNGLSDFDSLV
ncbi:Gtpase activating protein [Mycoemilia scoparia]|uniref:Gtpase activating protein n=1 Tax=Mycoemilia scoparia TaxID=417184 RepID=A0A9W7ZN98_9FUNG|nr:Gtpase activating protein [Mycoemilia scoparia]